MEGNRTVYERADKKTPGSTLAEFHNWQNDDCPLHHNNGHNVEGTPAVPHDQTSDADKEENSPDEELRQVEPEIHGRT